VAEFKVFNPAHKPAISASIPAPKSRNGEFIAGPVESRTLPSGKPGEWDGNSKAVRKPPARN
jgi:hypothetical protein